MIPWAKGKILTYFSGNIFYRYKFKCDDTLTVQRWTVVPKAISTSHPLVHTSVISQCVHTKLDSLDTAVSVFCTLIYVWDRKQNDAMQLILHCILSKFCMKKQNLWDHRYKNMYTLKISVPFIQNRSNSFSVDKRHNQTPWIILDQ